VEADGVGWGTVGFAHLGAPVTHGSPLTLQARPDRGKKPTNIRR